MRRARASIRIPRAPRADPIGRLPPRRSGVDAKYRTLVPLCKLAPEKIEDSLKVVHEFETVKTMSERTSLLRSLSGLSPTNS